MEMYRQIIKAQLVYAFHGKCQMCGKPATDLHEIPNKAHCPDELVPVELRSLLCQGCHSQAEMKVKELTQLNVSHYGLVAMQVAWRDLQSKVRLPIGLKRLIEEAING